MTMRDEKGRFLKASELPSILDDPHVQAMSPAVAQWPPSPEETEREDALVFLNKQFDPTDEPKSELPGHVFYDRPSTLRMPPGPKDGSSLAYFTLVFAAGFVGGCVFWWIVLGGGHG